MLLADMNCSCMACGCARAADEVWGVVFLGIPQMQIWPVDIMLKMYWLLASHVKPACNIMYRLAMQIPLSMGTYTLCSQKAKHCVDNKHNTCPEYCQEYCQTKEHLQSRVGKDSVHNMSSSTIKDIFTYDSSCVCPCYVCLPGGISF